MKVKAQNLTKKQRVETLDALYTAAGSLKGREVMKMFLRDLLTESERVMLGRRIIIAKQILKGAGYDTIQTELKVSKTTIAKVHRWLTDEVPGYEKALQSMEMEIKKRKKRSESKKAFANLKRKYPLHFLLFPWPKGFGSKK